ncbi:hypothetical protein AVEN_60382-1 [Araneus ventricosus]|uniref:Uncharacterized protein n=1 Tax=Araneus ventricosus TaxID=182803 RepID=A0A4Y2H3E9_ARAVE|nr:hypothetical protein AVEN_60382-1 [Araneus ventricosus]
MQKLDGPYIILTQKSPTSYVIANPNNPNEPVGTYHTSALKVYKQDEIATQVHPLRKRKTTKDLYFWLLTETSGRGRNQRGESVTITFFLALLPVDSAARTFRNHKHDRQSDLTVLARTVAFPSHGDGHKSRQS